MTKIDELIQELCPDGVETFPLEECCNILDKKRKPVTKNSREKGEYPYYGANGVQDYVSDYIFNGKFVLVGEDGSVITKSGTPVVTWAEGKIWVNNHAHVIEEKSGTMLRYLYFYIQTIDVTSLIHGNIPKLTGRDFRSLKIALPPLEIQREIVSILDNFTNLTAELTAELTARKTQYGYYRDKLLEVETDIHKYTLGEIATVTKLAGFEFTNYVTYSERGNIIALRGLNVKNGKLDLSDVKYIDKSDFSKLERSKLHIGDMLFTYVGTVGQVAIVDEEDKYYLAPNVALIRFDKKILLPQYMKYYFQTTQFWDKQIRRLLQSSSMQNIPMEKIRKFEIIVPPFDVQNRIVNVLDNFEKICSDLNIGLPAEIEARQKQYEYYRDKLLTFAETGNTILSRAEQSRAEQSRAEQSRAEQSRALIKLLQYVFGYAVVTLEDIAENCDSMRKPVTSGKREAGEYPYYGASGIVDYVKGYIFDGDYLLVSEDGANLLARSTPIAFSISGKNWVNNHAHVLKFDCYETRRFVEFYLNSIDLAPYISGGAQPKLNQKNLNRIEIPLPSQERQKYIVDILDRFDAICNDLTSGLPAEIEARQKQYEYYRDKLLSFKERL